jgi:hypothetical protein
MGLGPETPKSCLARARYAFEQAERSKDDSDKHQWLMLAKEWTELANALRAKESQINPLSN